ncbi:type III secretion protein [Paracidovorax anthurii]|nr:type III secretion protein [Paracidovorax anthurii]
MLAPRAALGTAPAALRWGGEAPLEQHQIQQAAYLLGVQVVEGGLTSPRRWAAAGQTVHDVRSLLKHGRGNVLADDAPSGGHNGIGSSVAAREPDYERGLAVAAVMGAAVCDQHAGLATLLHAPHMASGERMATVSASVNLHRPAEQGEERVPGSAHTWSELHRDSDEQQGGKSAIVMDPWANGPAVRFKDSAWRRVAKKIDDSLDREEAAQGKQLIENLVPHAHPDQDEDIARTLNLKRRKPTDWDKYAEAQVVSRKFAKKVRENLSALPLEEQKAMASRIVQDTYGLAPGTAAHREAVRSVLEAAQHLQRLPRPAVVPPAG